MVALQIFSFSVLFDGNNQWIIVARNMKFVIYRRWI